MWQSPPQDTLLQICSIKQPLSSGYIAAACLLEPPQCFTQFREATSSAFCNRTTKLSWWIMLYLLNLLSTDESHSVNSYQERGTRGITINNRLCKNWCSSYSRTDIKIVDSASRFTGLPSVSEDFSARRRWNLLHPVWSAIDSKLKERTGMLWGEETSQHLKNLKIKRFTGPRETACYNSWHSGTLPNMEWIWGKLPILHWQ